VAWWDVCRQGTDCAAWNPTPGNGQRNDVSVPLPVGTTITSPVDGIILPQHPGGGFFSYYGRQDWGGEVDIASYLPDYGGVKNVNILHLDTITVRPGTTVKRGDVIGTSGGQTSGGHWPSNPRWSTGPHVGIGVHDMASWDAMRDPAILMRRLWSGVGGSVLPSQNQLQGSGIGDIPRTGPATGIPLTDTTSQTSSGDCGPQPDPSNYALKYTDPLFWKDLAAWELCRANKNVNPWEVIKAQFRVIFHFLDQPIRIFKFGAGLLLIIIAAGLFIAVPALEATGAATRQPGITAVGRALHAPSQKSAGRVAGGFAASSRQAARQRQARAPRGRQARPQAAPPAAPSVKPAPAPGGATP
jgi:hypothetical protein